MGRRADVKSPEWVGGRGAVPSFLAGTAAFDCAAMPDGETITALHYVGYDEDRGGILSVIRALAGEERFQCVLGVNPGFRPGATRLPWREFSAVAGDVIGPANLWRTRRVAREARAWLREDETRIFHGHSRAGLLTALWLHGHGERRVVATVHCYGRQRWFYRWAERRLKRRVRWLTPAMKRYYGIGDETWEECAPGCVRLEDWAGVSRKAADGGMRFGCVGTLVRVKEWERVIEALRRVPRAAGVCVLHAGGEDGSKESATYAAELRARAVALGARWQWRGPTRDMAGFYGEIDCLVIAARHEGFSIAALEAGAAGVPVLAGNTGGNRDLIEAARLGWSFRAGSAEALATEMQRLAETDEARRWRRDENAFRRFTAAAAAQAHRDWYWRAMRDEL